MQPDFLLRYKYVLDRRELQQAIGPAPDCWTWNGAGTAMHKVATLPEIIMEVENDPLDDQFP